MSGWASPVLAVVIAFLLLGVENIGAFIEEPFHVSSAACIAFLSQPASIEV
jgi:predicted membrane chloride channel (bestrophin family)